MSFFLSIWKNEIINLIRKLCFLTSDNSSQRSVLPRFPNKCLFNAKGEMGSSSLYCIQYDNYCSTGIYWKPTHPPTTSSIPGFTEDNCPLDVHNYWCISKQAIARQKRDLNRSWGWSWKHQCCGSGSGRIQTFCRIQIQANRPDPTQNMS